MIITIAQLVVFLLIFARIVGIFIQAPILSTRLIPAYVKVTLSIWVAVALWFVVPLKAAIPPDMPTMALALVNEVMLGFLIGFVCNLIFYAVQAAGDIMDLQMGMSIATVVSPTTGGVVSVVGMLAFFLALAVFVAADGHHMILSSFNQSFKLLPLAAPLNFADGRIVMQIIEVVKGLWLTAVQLAAPIVLLIFLSDFSFGIVSRVAPQVNVFMLGFQVKPSLGFLGILLALPLLVRHITSLIARMGDEMLKLLVALKP
jgi:flagellar biosynthetic protein FliR